MHPRNRHQDRYDLKKLSESFPPLLTFIHLNKYGDESIDFSVPEAVKALNQAILKSLYHLEWDLPAKFLCPPVPGRADYIHYAADLIGPLKKNVRVLDVGVGANCIYPLIGVTEYGWDFVGSDINEEAIKVAQENVFRNPQIAGKIVLRKQNDAKSIFNNIIFAGEKFDLTICNPPFHASLEDALTGTERKWKNLGKNQRSPKTLNFGGTGAELWTEGGEKKFLQTLISESKSFKDQVVWFTTLVSKEENLPFLHKLLEKAQVKRSKVIDMTQGNKKSRLLAWSFT